MNPFVAFFLGAVIGGILVWCLSEFNWRGKMIPIKEAGEAAEERVAELEERAKSWEQEQPILAEQVRTLQANLTAKGESTLNASREVERLQADLFSAKANITRLEYDLTRLQNEKMPLEGQVSQLQLEKAQLSSEVERVKFQLQKTQGEQAK